jgi:riboflavin kinase/FMN adenylyltransferase
MEQISLAAELAAVAPERDTALTVGVFDGVHRGHRYLLARLKDRAAARGLASGVVTLHPHPALVLDPLAPIVYLTSLEERVELLRTSDVDFVLPVTFTPEVARLSARDFVGALTEGLRMRFLLGGPDFALGRAREGSAKVLSRLGLEMGFEVELAAPLLEGDRVVSSSAVRDALAAGDVEAAGNLLGRPFSLHGPVVRGVERGRVVVGFPTANIAVGPGMALPAFGVYATRAYLPAGQAGVGVVARMSVTNIGRRPTFEDGERTVEVYIMDFDGDIYGRELRVDVLKRLRGEERFSDTQGLVEQIRRDVAAAREYLQSHTAG